METESERYKQMLVCVLEGHNQSAATGLPLQQSDTYLKSQAANSNLVPPLEFEKVIADQEKKGNILLTNKLRMTNFEALRWKNNYDDSVFPNSFKLVNINKPNNQQIGNSRLKQLNFSVLSHTVEELVQFSVAILSSNEYCKSAFQRTVIKGLIIQIASNYNIVAYHNFSHAFSLMLLNYQCLERQASLKSSYSSQQIFHILVAGLAHDISHKGTNNAYEVKKKSQMALMVDNQAVLQNMHLRTLWKILDKNEGFNIVKKAKNPQKCKKLITRLILNTDVSRHFKNLQILKSKIERNDLNLQSDEQTRYFFMEQLFHACDIGNPCVDYQSYLNWAALLSHQFNEQAKLELAENLQVTQMFVYKGLDSLHRDQTWFVGSLVYPLWKQIEGVCAGLRPMVANIQANIKRLSQQQFQQK